MVFQLLLGNGQDLQLAAISTLSRSQMPVTEPGASSSSPGHRLGTVELSKAARLCPTLTSEAPPERQLLTRSCYTQVRLCLCHLDSEQFQLTMAGWGVRGKREE